MENCNTCNACSFPSKVAQAKAELPDIWKQELYTEEAPDHIWITALNLYNDFVQSKTEVPSSFLELLTGGELTEEDFAWAHQVMSFKNNNMQV